jgi:NDP-sugar pyrophosphorylase family protein
VSGQAVVLAGGRATRLGELARSTPKYLLPIAGRPFAHWQLGRLATCGLSDVVLCIGHLGDAIRSALGDGATLGVSIRYSDDGDALLGTGGALHNALPLLADACVVTYGDSYLPFDYAAPLAELGRHPEAMGCMSVYRNEGRLDRSYVAVGDGRVTRYDKRAPPGTLGFIDYGAVALRRPAIEALPPGPSDLAEHLAALAGAGTLLALEATERFYEIGSPEGVRALQARLSAAPQRGAPEPGAGGGT